MRKFDESFDILFLGITAWRKGENLEGVVNDNFTIILVWVRLFRDLVQDKTKLDLS